ncbi:MAG TPA: cupin domain-containing protein [Ktedonobacteraceae bacterium]|nr:cupin domain-containing protein [Ktedonobacteraceae bacterium]
MDMDIFETAQLIDEQDRAQHIYHEFLRMPSISAGLYTLPAGSIDMQQPHTEDEVYYVISGRAAFRGGSEERSVQAGSIIYVKAHVEHRFHSISEDLRVLVIFAPAEYSNAPDGH